DAGLVRACAELDGRRIAAQAERPAVVERTHAVRAGRQPGQLIRAGGVGQALDAAGDRAVADRGALAARHLARDDADAGDRLALAVDDAAGDRAARGHIDDDLGHAGRDLGLRGALIAARTARADPDPARRDRRELELAVGPGRRGR